MKIFLLRHAESTSNATNKADSQIDAELTKKGLKQARDLIPVLQRLEIDIFVVSPLKRTLETIKPFLGTIKKQVLLKNELTLERNLGDFTGTPMETFQKFCDDNGLDRVFHTPPNGESIADTYKRAKEFLNFLLIRYSSKKVLVCGHKNFLMCLEIAITGKKIEKYYSYKALKTGELREFDI